MCLWAVSQCGCVCVCVFYFHFLDECFFFISVDCFRSKAVDVWVCIYWAASRYHRQKAQKARILTVILRSDSMKPMVREQHRIYFFFFGQAKNKHEQAEEETISHFWANWLFDILFFALPFLSCASGVCFVWKSCKQLDHHNVIKVASEKWKQLIRVRMVEGRKRKPTK